MIQIDIWTDITRMLLKKKIAKQLLFISRMPKLCAILQLVSAPLNPVKCYAKMKCDVRCPAILSHEYIQKSLWDPKLLKVFAWESLYGLNKEHLNISSLKVLSRYNYNVFSLQSMRWGGKILKDSAGDLWKVSLTHLFISLVNQPCL